MPIASAVLSVRQAPSRHSWTQPPKRTIRYDKQRYCDRHLVENAFCHLKTSAALLHVPRIMVPVGLHDTKVSMISTRCSICSRPRRAGACPAAPGADGGKPGEGIDLDTSRSGPEE